MECFAPERGKTPPEGGRPQKLPDQLIRPQSAQSFPDPLRRILANRHHIYFRFSVPGFSSALS